MLWTTRNRHPGDDKRDTVPRPTAITLVGRIVQSLYSDGMQWLTIPVLALLAYLHFNHVDNEVLTAVVLVGLTVLAMVRGSKAWQHDLNDYQRHLSRMRHREWQESPRHIPGYFPSEGSRRY